MRFGKYNLKIDQARARSKQEPKPSEQLPSKKRNARVARVCPQHDIRPGYSCSG